MEKASSPYGDDFEKQMTEINLGTALANAQLGHDFNGVYLYCDPISGEHKVISQLMKEIGIEPNGGGEIDPGYHYNKMEGTLAICGDDAVKAIIAAGFSFPGIELVGKTLGINVPSPKKFIER